MRRRAMPIASMYSHFTTVRSHALRPRTGLDCASSRQRSSVFVPMPISRATNSTAALCGGNNRATALSLNACPYRAIFLPYRPQVSDSIDATTILTRGGIYLSCAIRVGWIRRVRLRTIRQVGAQAHPTCLPSSSYAHNPTGSGNPARSSAPSGPSGATPYRSSTAAS